MTLESTITCTSCRAGSVHTMASDACVFSGSYGSVPCPPRQAAKNCCS